jgi:hypothetical protein
MAPSVQEIVANIPSVNPAKLIAIAKAKEEAPEQETPRVKRQIDIEGGKTDAKVLSEPSKMTSC